MSSAQPSPNAPQMYCFKCRASTDSKETEQVVLKNGRDAVRGVCADCGERGSVWGSCADFGQSNSPLSGAASSRLITERQLTGCTLASRWLLRRFLVLQLQNNKR